MLKKVVVLIFVFLNGVLLANAQSNFAGPATKMKPAFQRLLLELSTTYFTVVKENQVDLDSSLIHVSRSLSLSRSLIIGQGMDDKDLLDNATWIDERNPSAGQKQLDLATGQKHPALLILMGAYYAFEPGNDSVANNKSKAYLTAGISELNGSNNLQLKLAGQRLLAKLYLKDRNFTAADNLFARVRDGFITAGNPSEAAVTCSWWGLYAPVTATSTAPRIEHTEMAAKLFQSLGEKEGQINALTNDSYLHMLNYDMPTASKLAKQAFDLTETIGFPYSHYVTGALMSIEMFQGKFGEPLAYSIESVESAERVKDDVALPYYYGVVASLYQNEDGKEETAIDWEHKSINYFLSQHEPCYMSLNDMVTLLLLLGRKAEALESIKNVTNQVPPITTIDHLFYNLTMGLYDSYTKQWRLAHNFFDKAAIQEKELEKHGLNVRKPTILINMANLYFKEENYKQAKIYYLQYLSQPSILKGGFFADNADALETLVAIDSITGDYKAQLKDYRRLTDVISQNYTVAKTRLAEELQVKYATTERMNQINLLKQNAKLEQANLQKANLTKNITVGGILLLLIIAGLLYRQGKIRKKNNDIITRKNELMQQLLDEKEWLVKEIHHRVKNNLHTIICLLESQAVYLENDALKAIETSQHRIYAMSLIHQKLYQSDDIKVVDLNSYVTEFIQYLIDSFGSPANIHVELQAEHIKLGASQAIPLGLIINEAVNNSFKYAFPHQADGLIKIELKKINDDIYLTVTDNGVGFQQQLGQETNSLGLELIKGLTLDLRGEVNFGLNNGVSIQIHFPIDHVGFPTDEGDALLLNV